MSDYDPCLSQITFDIVVLSKYLLLLLLHVALNQGILSQKLVMTICHSPSSIEAIHIAGLVP